MGWAMSTSEKKTLTPEIADPEQHTEKMLLERLKNSKTEDDYFRWMLFVVGFYRGINKMEAAATLLKDFLKQSHNDEQKAHCQLALGQMATDENRLEAALNHFQAALVFQPKKKKVAYVLHNNIGYCLNTLGRYAEGEKHCRIAIEINWTRASGYRNLGVSLQGKGNPIGAAWAYVEAVKAEASDPRARALLEKLLSQHPAIVMRCPWIVDGMNPNLKATAGLSPV
jgi:tetratricopeptide (TPR) repeat protein